MSTHRRVSTGPLHYGRNGLYWWGQFTFEGGKFMPNRWGLVGKWYGSIEELSEARGSS